MKNPLHFNFFRREKYFHIVWICFMLLTSGLYAQRGYYDAAYKRYEANVGQLSNGAATTSKSYVQSDLQSEATDQQCVNMSATNATVQWTLTEAADGLVIRYSVPDGQTATLGVYDGNTKITTLTLTSTWSWEYLWSNGNPNNNGITNQNPRMRFDEVRYKLPNKIAVSGTLKLVRESGNVHVDFAEIEPVATAITAPSGAVTYTGNGSDLQTFIDANGGKKIFLPTGVYSVNRELYFGTANTSLIGAGMWYTQINFTNTSSLNGGLRANAAGISFTDLYLTTNSASRSNSYKGINGVFTSTSVVKNIWAEHFECGAWIAQYNTGGPAIADGFTLSHCRFRNNYADGINLCKGTANAIVEHCNFRNNGDDDQAIWSADGLECINNTFRYNTSENCWRACGLAIYGGKNNKAYNLIIKDNLEAGIRVSNNFPGAPFNNDGMHEIHDITVSTCGTFNDTYNNPVAAVDIFSATNAGSQVKNVQLYNIDILDSRNDAISISKRSGDGIYNLSFKDITVNGTGKEYPNNNALNRNWGRGYFVLIAGSPAGNGTYCNMNYSNRGGSAAANEEISAIGTFSWTQSASCSTTSVPVTGVTISPTTATLGVGATQQLTPTIAPANATNKTVSYSSNNTGVATVNGSGLVTAIASGSATITVTTQDGAKTATAVITVSSSNVAVTSVSLSPTSASLSVGATQQLTPTVLPSNATNKSVSYASNNTGVATVNASGLVTAIASGTATITVTTVDGNKTSTAAITVTTATGNYFTIKNKWTGNYLYDAGANVGYGPTVANNNYKWEKVAVDATYYILKNVGTGDMMNIENLTGAVQCNVGSNGWYSAQWSTENVDATWVRIKNRWQTGSMIHIENLNGSAQYAGAQNNWESAQWQFQSTSTSKKANGIEEAVTIENNSLVSLYPNPSINNEFNVVFPELKAGNQATVTVTDINGRKVLVNKLNVSAKIDHHLTSGVYIVTISSNEFNVSKKLIVK
ncbi:putative secreted protein (Por secretion system target) [Flavobacterium sp. 90]|uniref:Ig-like domain-containing protein n=1 Tax=unclassified Flavobacterium TaxID=196869 RepID=UPI000EB5ABCF|nr:MULTISPECIES: Ig-like domain-containing protein [unclassified Flavobacterium]RKR05722.1 putative secreted protein (Por secretion system target) [Flavobacterium sp. 81]TCK57033.1 putative secreted protein (Por secretion system target) [Flavobacterium sp. 90]